MLLYHSVHKPAPCERQLAYIIKSLTFLAILIPNNLLEGLLGLNPKSQEDTLPDFSHLLLRSTLNSLTAGKEQQEPSQELMEKGLKPAKIFPQI